MQNNSDISKRQEKIRTAIIHSIAVLLIPIVLLFILPFNEEWSKGVYISSVIFIFTACIIFYANYFFLIKKFLKKRKIWSYIFTNIFVVFILSVITRFILLIIPNIILPEGLTSASNYLRFFIRSIPFSSICIILAIAIRMTTDWYKTEQEKTKILAEANQAELNNLKSQLNPHFLFNTLNNIYALIDINSDKAQKAVLELSKLLRYAIYDNNNDSIPLNKELQFTKSYIELMSLRLTNNVDVKVNIPEDSGALTIAPLMFITLIENAYKHGVSQHEPSFIDINIGIDYNTVKCVVRNTNFPKSQNDYSGSGIGITNLRRRLELLYPDKYTYETSISDNIYTASLEIELD